MEPEQMTLASEGTATRRHPPRPLPWIGADSSRARRAGDTAGTERQAAKGTGGPGDPGHGCPPFRRAEAGVLDRGPQTAPPCVSRWNYFFLYDGSKVTGEGDPTRAGICYFYPPQTPLDHQELLCGQIAGVVHCVSEVSSSAPALVRLRKLKFAVRVDGDYLWALGCIVELPDVSCRQLLDQLIGFFRFHHGPVALAYRHHSREALSAEWDASIRRILRSSGDLHRVFNSLWNLDRTQACQRAPHILAGCILHRDLIVSTQLPPSLTAKVLLCRAAARDQSVPTGGQVLPKPAPGVVLPPDVQIESVFLTLEEAAVLREFPAEGLTGRPEPAAQQPPEGQSTPLVTETPPGPGPRGTAGSSGQEGQGCTSTSDQEQWGPLPADARAPPSGQEGQDHAASQSQESDVSLRLDSPAWAPGPGLHGPPGKGPASLGEEELDWPEPRVPGAAASPCRGTPAEPPEPGDTAPSSCYTPSPETPSQNGAAEQLGGLPGCGSQAPACREEPLPGETGRPWASSSAPRQRGPEPPEGGPGGPAADCAGADDGAGRVPLEGLVPMNLYTHRVKGLVLALLAESPLLGDPEAIQEVHHSSLASLNGLEVHLQETLPPAAAPAGSRRAYNFTHFDRVQNVLAANQPQAATAQDRRFLQAITLMHTDFAQMPTLYEMTVGNAATAVFACCSPVQETYFQQLGPTARSSGFPSAQDAAFSLPSRARQKLLKHGVNLL
ncbi:BLOC-3 complex member HPS4 isoform X3 [Erinaceus europaeus]|uniref:BLOC-3 complex member HPS4 isoform X3 n=1 Tax=Erinaceus europaeus TaxID=9365 RepID=A0ABM3XIB5_ERIEU|nr:BLOC-3 complex member HPS4 isoform X3 [Erinaceus europaeus]